MLQKGDKYIHFTKYGGVNKGEVDEVFSNLTSIDTKNKVSYKKHFIKNTKGNTICLNDEEIYLIDKEYTEQEAFNIETNCKRLINSKNNVQK